MRNPKHEIRNKFEYRMTEITNGYPRQWHGRARVGGATNPSANGQSCAQAVLVILVSRFGFVSDFEIRISRANIDNLLSV